MTAAFFDGYFGWLYGQTDDSSLSSEGSHGQLFHHMHLTPFRWRIRNDDNRDEDGKSLRVEFLNAFNIDEPDHLWLDQPASVLEMLIALSRRASFESDGTPGEWLQLFLRNLELSRYTDDKYNEYIEELVDDALETLISRRYSREGLGGLFPLRHPRHDQRKVEIWYQLQAYLLEGNHVLA